jgi:lysozyme family protein
MSDFDTAINYVLKNEKGLEENPNDPGGISNFGISLRFLKCIPAERLKNYAIFGDVDADTIKLLTIQQAKQIYHGEFWLNAPFDKIYNQDFTNYIFDMAINMGIAPAIKCVQRACWAVMKRWDQLPDDGILGEKTLMTIKMCAFLLMPALRAERGAFYRNLSNEKEFLDGWYNRTYCR